MAYIFRTAGPWGPGKGSDLDPVEVDANFWQAIQDIAAKSAQGVGIANAVVSGNQLTFVLTDHTLLGPYTLPVAQLTFKGEWQPNTPYLAGDIVTHGGAVYMVEVNHTSQATFDPGANDGHGNDFYGLLLTQPSLTLPTGGALGTFLRKSGAGDFVTAWQTAALTDLSDVSLGSPTEGQVLTYLHGVWMNSILVASLSQLTDTNISSPITGQVLEWNGNHWINATPITALSGLDDVNIASPLAGQTLQWSGGSPGYWHNVTAVFALSGLSDVLLGGTLYTNQPLIWNGVKWSNGNAADMLVQNLGNKSGSITIDLRFNEFNQFAMTQDVNVTFQWPSYTGQFVRRALEVTNTGAYTLSWPLSIKWPGGVAPTQTPYATDVFVLYTHDGGATVYGNIVGQNYLVV